jgi:glycosyltransferase involved in cell wall biosynthesis
MTNPHVEIADFQLLPKAPKVSIIVMTYAHELYLEEAIDSLASQITSFEYEILVGEDASPDRTREVALRLQAKYPHLIRLFYSERNRGMGGNFRFLINFCRGEYFAGCEGDDFWIDDQKLQRQVDALDTVRTVDMAFTRGYELHMDGTRVPGWDYGGEPRVVSAEEMFRGLGFIAPAGSGMMRGDLIRGLPEWMDKSPGADMLHYMAGSSRGGAWYDPNFTICYRRAHPTSFTVLHDSRSDAEYVAYFKSLLHHIDKTCARYGVPRAILAERINDYRLQIAKHSLRQRKLLTALYHFGKLDPGFVGKGIARRIARISGNRQPTPGG